MPRNLAAAVAKGDVAVSIVYMINILNELEY